MNRCEAMKELLVLYAEGALEPQEDRRVAEHLAVCATCRAEAEQIGIVRGWLADPELFEPAPDLAWQLLPEKLSGRARLLEQKRTGWSRLRVPLWVSGIAATLVLASGLVWMLRRPAPSPPVLAASGNQAFLSKVRTAHAREATTVYLAGCQDLLMDLIGSEKKCEGDLYDVSFEVARARRLLQQKRFLDAELRVPEIERAKGLCDDLERFLLNVSTSPECESRDAIDSMGRFIEKERLLLRINLMQSGIS